MDNTFNIISKKSLLSLSLSKDDLAKVTAAAVYAEAHGEYITVVGEDYDYGDGDYKTVIYYVGSESADWVENYSNSGGLWWYQSPKEFL